MVPYVSFLSVLDYWLSSRYACGCGERLYTAKEAIEYLDLSQDAFYRYVKNWLPTYHYGAFRREYFRQTDLDRYKGIRPAEEDKQGRA